MRERKEQDNLLYANASAAEMRMNALIPEIYTAATEPRKWRPVLREVCEILHAERCAIVELHAVSANGPARLRLYRSDDDPAADYSTETQFPLPGMGDRFELEVTDLPTDMSADRQSALDTVLPHIAKAVEIGHPRSDPGLVQIGLLTAMERLRIGLAVLDRHGSVVAANEEFRRQSETIGAMRIDPSGRLHLRAEAHRAALSEALGQTADAHSVPQALSQDALIAYGKEEDTVLCIKIAPLIRSDGFGKTGVDGVLVYSVDSSKPLSFDAAAISQAFGLTGTEELLATLLADGMTNAQIAERRNRSVATINVQVKSLLAKTNSANRTQLVRLMTNFGSGLWALDPVSPSGLADPAH